MALSDLDLDHDYPPKQSSLFRPLCASCGRDQLRPTSGRRSPPDAGFCPSCGVYIGFECAQKAGWRNWKRLCPACGKRLRPNTLVSFVLFGSIIWLIMTFIFMIPIGLDIIHHGEIEKTQANMPAVDPGQVHLGDTIKIAGTVTGPQQTPITGASSGMGRSYRFTWTAQDFYINCNNGPVKVLASELSNTSSSSGQIIGSDGATGAYNIGTPVVVIGVVSEVKPQVVIEPSRIAPTSAAFDRGLIANGWGFILMGPIMLPVFAVALWTYFGRFISHRRRVGDFRIGQTTRQRVSFDQIRGIAAPVNSSEDREDIGQYSTERASVEDLEDETEPGR